MVREVLCLLQLSLGLAGYFIAKVLLGCIAVSDILPPLKR